LNAHKPIRYHAYSYDISNTLTPLQFNKYRKRYNKKSIYLSTLPQKNARSDLAAGHLYTSLNLILAIVSYQSAELNNQLLIDM
jgi:hypothetical protein